MPGSPIVTFDAVSVARPGGDVVLRDITWTPREGETWAIVGPMGSGKTTLAEVVIGRLHASAGEVTWPLLEALRAGGRTIAWPSEVMRLVAFKEDSRLFSYVDHYYQQRFEFADEEEPLSLDHFLRADLPASEAEIADVTEHLGIAGLRPLSFMKLSNGQARRARIARALLAKPELLILDDPFIGLDIAGRAELAEMLGTLVARGQRLLLIAPRNRVPAWITHSLELEHGAVVRSGSHTPAPSPEAESSRPVPSTRSMDDAPPVIELRDVNVAHGGKPILRNVSWTVRAGERWALLGPNGAGKTTLLSILCGDHPQAYANDVRLFGTRRGTGESIWDVKRRIGLVSPELHLYFTTPLSAFEAAVTGFHDVLAYREPTPEQAATVQEFFAAFGLAPLADKPFRRLSTGEQRLVLLVRALVKRPALLVLDEPFQGFDGDTVRRVRDWLDRELQPEQTLIFVSHIAEEIPRCVTQRLDIAAGVVSPGGTVGARPS